MNSGIYQIRNTINNHIYIGSTKNFENRRKKHFTQLRKGNHHSIYLQRAFDKYGEENFVFEILEECDEKLLLVYEQQYLDNLQPEYNVSTVASNCVLYGSSNGMYGKLGEKNPNYGRKNTEETLQKMSIAQKGRIVKPETIDKFKATLHSHYPEGRPSSFKGRHHGSSSKEKLKQAHIKPVKQLDKNTLEVINVFESGLQAKEVTGINNATINHCCHHDEHYNTAGGYKWEFCTMEEYNAYQNNHRND